MQDLNNTPAPLDPDSIEGKLSAAQSLVDVIQANAEPVTPEMLQLGVTINEALAEVRGAKTLVMGA